MEQYQQFIGRQVVKKSRRPFKSGNKVNTVKGIEQHPYLPGKLAFTFVEDTSFVSCEICAEFKR